MENENAYPNHHRPHPSQPPHTYRCVPPHKKCQKWLLILTFLLLQLRPVHPQDCDIHLYTDSHCYLEPDSSEEKSKGEEFLNKLKNYFDSCVEDEVHLGTYMMIRCKNNKLFGVEYSDAECKTEPKVAETHLPFDMIKWEPVYYDVCIKTQLEGFYMKVVDPSKHTHKASGATFLGFRKLAAKLSFLMVLAFFSGSFE